MFYFSSVCRKTKKINFFPFTNRLIKFVIRAITASNVPPLNSLSLHNHFDIFQHHLSFTAWITRIQVCSFINSLEFFKIAFLSFNFEKLHAPNFNAAAGWFPNLRRLFYQHSFRCGIILVVLNSVWLT